MAFYHIGDQLDLIKEKPFKLEKDIQSLTEKNLKKLLNLDFVRSEFSIGTFRIDTLAYDTENRCFVIIEFKRDRNFSVIDQGYAYLSLMLNNKADFILEYNESLKAKLKRTDVDWSQSKVIFVAPQFTSYQLEAINFNDLPIELWEIKRFDNNIFSFNQIRRTSARESIKTLSGSNKTVETVSKEIKVFTEQDHLQHANPDILELYEQFKERLLNLNGDISLQPKKQTIGFKVENAIFCDVIVQNKGLKIQLNLKSGELHDPCSRARDVSNVGHWGNGSYEVRLYNIEEMDEVMSLVKQAVEKNENA